MQPLLGSSFINYPVLIHLPANQVKMINKIVQNLRPAHRCTKNVKEISTYALMLRDCCLLPLQLANYSSKGPVISIEIKPKQGYMKNAGNLSGDQILKTGVCSFCMRQHYRLKKMIIERKSGYCPLDLFSGCKMRMQYAIKQLLETPQNYLKIFKNQKLIFCQENKADLLPLMDEFFGKESHEKKLDVFCDLVIQALLSPFNSEEVSNIQSNMSHKQQFCKYSCNYLQQNERKHSDGLPSSCVLGRILQLQKLDSIDIAHIYSMYLKIKGSCSDLLNNSNLHLVDGYPRNEIPVEIGKHERQSSETEISYMARKIWEFLVALSAKDFSVMVVLQQLCENAVPLVPSEHVITGSNNKSYVFSMSVIDLDSKPLNKVEKVYNENQEMLKAYAVNV
ncbi:inositol-pentakisphosphate 2-kinase isoform X2 [Centruroides vittatus]